MSEENKFVEHHIYAAKKTPVTKEFEDTRDALLSAAASRGFPKTPGYAEDILSRLEDEAKHKVTDVNAAVVEGEADIILKDLEFWAKLALKYGLLQLEYYRESLARALEWEEAQVDDLRKRNAADIRKLRADVDAMSIALILARAQLEEYLTTLRLRQIDAEKSVLGKELELINAKIETATERLRIIDATRRLIDIEMVILYAEERRAEALERLLAVEGVTADMEAGLIPRYLEEADARLALAAAIEDSVIWQRLLIELDYEKLRLKQTEQAAQLQELGAEALIETARSDFMEADAATQLQRQRADTELTAERTDVSSAIVGLRKAIDVMKLNTAASVRWEPVLAELSRRLENTYRDIEYKRLRFEAVVGAEGQIAAVTGYQVGTINQRRYQRVTEYATRLIDQLITSDEA